jgi:hypothetical protein
MAEIERIFKINVPKEYSYTHIKNHFKMIESKFKGRIKIKFIEDIEYQRIKIELKAPILGPKIFSYDFYEVDSNITEIKLNINTGWLSMKNLKKTIDMLVNDLKLNIEHDYSSLK